MSESTRIRIGCQGWNYPDWITKAGGDTVFYPRGTRPGDMLSLYAELFDTVEVDSTFYAIPPVSTFESWYEKTPAEFVFSPKLPQEITHEHNLRESSYAALDEFCTRAAELKEKLGVILVQLGPQFDATRENAQRLRKFLARLPAELRFAVEFREPGWMVEWTFEELEKSGAALCLVEGNWIPRTEMFDAAAKLNARFAYVRFMGERDLVKFDRIYRHRDDDLRSWSNAVRAIPANEIFVYVSNIYEGHAPATVNKLKQLLGQKKADAASLENQASLF